MQAFVDVPPEVAEVAHTFWSGVTGWPPDRQWADHPEFTALVAPMGTGGVSLQVDDVAPRVHLDLYPDGDPDDLVDRLLSIGARSVQRHEWWHVLESPGGLPFCVVQEASGSPAPPTAWPDGHRSRVVRVCVDIPAARWDVELRFWPAALGWATTRGSREESPTWWRRRRARFECSCNACGPTTPARWCGRTSTWVPMTWVPKSGGWCGSGRVSANSPTTRAAGWC